MRKQGKLWAQATLLGLLLMSCRKEDNAAIQQLDIPVKSSVTISASSRAAEVYKEQEKIIDFEAGQFVQCANNGKGEYVSFSGTLHTVYHSTVKGDKYSVITVSNPQGVVGVGSETGDKYRGVGVTRREIKGDYTLNEYIHFTYLNNFQVIGPGPGNNFTVHAQTRTHINPDGEIKLSIDKITTECK